MYEKFVGKRRFEGEIGRRNDARTRKILRGRLDMGHFKCQLIGVWVNR